MLASLVSVGYYQRLAPHLWQAPVQQTSCLARRQRIDLRKPISRGHKRDNTVANQAHRATGRR